MKTKANSSSTGCRALAYLGIILVNTHMKVLSIILTAGLIFSIQLYADSYEGYESTIEGVGLWWLDPKYADRSNVEKKMRFGENPEYSIYCDGNNELFIYEFMSKGFPCKTSLWIEFKGWNSDETYVEHKTFDAEELSQISELAKKEKYSDAYESEYIVELFGLEIEEQGIFTVSKSKLSNGGWKIKPVSDDLLQDLQELVADKYDCPSECYPLKSRVPTFPVSSNVKIESSEIEKWAISIKENGREITIAPIAIVIYEGPEGESEGMILSSVFVKSAESYEYIGNLSGEIIRVGADIDNDQFPEIIVDNSVPESQEINYYRIYPSIKSLITYSHN